LGTAALGGLGMYNMANSIGGTGQGRAAGGTIKEERPAGLAELALYRMG
jgi:hypothetical protein